MTLLFLEQDNFNHTYVFDLKPVVCSVAVGSDDV